MGIISKLKSIFSDAAGDRPRSREGGTSVAVEGASGPEDEPVAEGERAVKGVGPTAGAADDVGEDEPAGSTAAAGPEGDPVDSIKGVGAAYAGRLAEAGVHTVGDLAEADAADLADETGLGSGRVGKWIERARARSR